MENILKIVSFAIRVISSILGVFTSKKPWKEDDMLPYRKDDDIE